MTTKVELLNHRQSRYQQTLDAKSIAGILLREHDTVEQAIRYAERMAQRYADSRSLLALEYQDAAEELKAWKQNKHP